MHSIGKMWELNLKQIQLPETPGVYAPELVLIETMYDRFYLKDQIEQKEIETI